MASNSAKKEKQLTAKRISETLKNIDKWTAVCDQGKPVVEAILAAKKDLTKESDFSHQLQESCDKLNEYLPKLEAILVSLEDLHEKIQSVHELSSLSLSNRSNPSFVLDESSSSSSTYDTIGLVLYHHRIIIDHLKPQLQVFQDVARNIGNANTLEQSVFLACSWTMQPHLNDDYFVAVEFLKSQNNNHE